MFLPTYLPEFSKEFYEVGTASCPILKTVKFGGFKVKFILNLIQVDTLLTFISKRVTARQRGPGVTGCSPCFAHFVFRMHKIREGVSP